MQVMRKVSYEQLVQLPLPVYSILTGLLLYAAWPTNSLPFISLIAFVPLLLLFDSIQKDQKKRKGLRFIVYTYLSLLLWNVSTTWWVYNSTAAGAIFAIVVNALLMSVPFIFIYSIRKRSPEWLGLLAFICFYLFFEYWHLNWQLSWPWLTLGNTWANMPFFVQWYEYTGVFGGSLWILTANVLIYLCIKSGTRKLTYITTSVIIIPVLISLLLFFTYTEKGTPVEVIVVQPNIDPYNEKFTGSPKAIPYPQQFARLLSMSESKRTSKTQFILWPETALPANLNEENLTEHALVQQLLQYSKKNHVSILTGIDSYRFMDEQHKTVTASKTADGKSYYDVYNAALIVNPDQTMGIYHKSRLVPGVESLPYPEIFGFVTDNLGDIVQPVGTDSIPKALFTPAHIGVAPVICYESIFGEYVSGYSQQGADFIGIITNDGWWGNTPGHMQHFQYARLRAIEQRKFVARAANTGISGFINQRGDILQKSSYWVKDVLVQTIKANHQLTFYAKHGDYIGLFALILSPLLFISSFFIKRYV